MAKKLEISANKIDNVRAGEAITAAGENVIRDTVRELARIQNPKAKKYHRIKMMRLTEVIGTQQSSTGLWHDRSAVDRYYDLTTNEWADGENTYDNVADPFGNLPADVDDLIPCAYHEQSDKWIPLWARTVRHAITCLDGNGDYPQEDGSDGLPDTYPIKFVKLEYVESAGRNPATITYLNPDANTHDDFVHHIAEDQADYLPFGSLICVYHVTGQWFTSGGGEPGLDESSGSSQSQNSSQSEQSSSQFGPGDSTQDQGESSSGGDCVGSIGGVRLDYIPGWNPNAKQALVHVAGEMCLQWQTIGSC